MSILLMVDISVFLLIIITANIYDAISQGSCLGLHAIYPIYLHLKSYEGNTIIT